LLGFIGRLDHQKGIDHLIDAVPPLLAQGAQLVTLGHGHEQFLRALKSLRDRYPSQVFIEDKFAEKFAHKIYAGVDLFLMPSRYEPCGLGQMIAMRYGAVPVVTPTGGLLDTVKPVLKKSGTGFIAADETSGAYISAVLEGMALLEEPRRLAAVQKSGMTEDRSWDRSVDKYEELYASAISWANQGT
jgi:starch synthase